MAIGLAQLQPDQQFLAHSGKSNNTLPKDFHLAAKLTKSLHAWHRHHNIPTNKQETKQFVSDQIQQHRRHSKQHLKIHSVKLVQQKRREGVIHCDDHFPNRVMWYCSTLSHQAITHTFSDPDVFAISPSPPLAPTLMFTQTSRNYFQKAKTKYSKGGPTVAFLNTMGRTLREASADVL